MMAFRAEEYLWFQMSEDNFDTFMMAQQRKKSSKRRSARENRKAPGFAGPFFIRSLAAG